MFLILAACNGTAVVTLTATPSTDTFLTYRVGLVSVDLQTSSGSTSSSALAASTTVDLANLTNLSEVLGSSAVSKATYKDVAITVDYSSAEIVYDDGSMNGIALTPVGANGQKLTQVTLTLTLDPSDSFTVTNSKVSRLALDFKLAASNIVNLSAKTVTVTPLIVASAQPIDSKTVRIRGPLKSVKTSATTYTSGVEPFDFPTLGAGSLVVTPSDATTYEINGTSYTGSAGLTQLASVNTGAPIDTLGTLTSTDSTTTTTTNGTTTSSTSTDLTFSATQVLAGTSVQNSSLDRLSGIVSARSGNTLTVEDATLIGGDGTNTFLSGTSTVQVSANTNVTQTGQGTSELNNIQQISVGSQITAFGTSTTPSNGAVTLDASAGLVRIGQSTASGLVTATGSGTLDLNLSSLGGRSVSAFEFTGTGASTGSYVLSTGALDLTNSTVGVPVEATGFTASFGASTPNFTASTLLDPTTIVAEMVVDWGTGTAAPFTTYDSSAIDVDARNSSIGTRHVIQVGAQSINIVGLASDPLITPTSTASIMLFAIGHTASATVDNYNTYDAFITALQSALTGSTLATGMTALGQYTSSSYAFSATSITVVLNN